MSECAVGKRRIAEASIFDYLAVDRKHLNVLRGARWLERVFVTPRYHHIHHGADLGHCNLNLGNVFTFWDRPFGTGLDPE